MIVVSPVIFTVVAQGVVKPLRWSRMFEGFLLLMAITGLGLLFFGASFSAWPNLPILLVPLMILVAFRFTPREVAVTNLLIAATVVIGAHHVLEPDLLGDSTEKTAHAVNAAADHQPDGPVTGRPCWPNAG